MERALEASLPRGCRRDIYWACEEGTPRMVAMQRAAQCAGLAHLDPSTHLSIHPTVGAWLSLRAVVVVDLPGVGPVPPPPLESPLSATERHEASAALQRAIARSSSNLCEELHGPNKDGERREESCDRGRPAWREWVALRDVVRLGRRYRFCEEQIEYHYTKDRARLRAAVLAEDAHASVEPAATAPERDPVAEPAPQRPAPAAMTSSNLGRTPPNRFSGSGPSFHSARGGGL